MATSFDFRSDDGTVVRGWSNDAAGGVPVVLSNGLGTIPQSWPGLVTPDSGYDVVSWYYRGTFGSPRPADRRRIRVEDHAADLLALMDARGLERALVACWSIGVNTAFEFAQRHPDRVAGIMAVAGVPGGTFSTMGGPLHVPRALRRPLAVRTARTVGHAGPLLTWLLPRVPVDDRTAWLLRHSGLVSTHASAETLVPMLREFLVQDWRWYLRLALAAAEHAPMDLGFVQCPTTLVAGTRDVLTSMHDVVDAAARIPHAQITVLPGTHFLPLERPALVQAALGELLRRSDLAA